MSKGNKCSGCFKKIEAYKNSLANRKDWEVKAKEADKKNIAYWENAYENPKWGGGGVYPNNSPIYCEYGCEVAGMPNTQGCGSVEKYCKKCNTTYDLECNEHDDVETDNHLASCQGKKCRKCGSNFIGDDCQKCEDNKEKLELEQQINQLQQDLRMMKRMKDHPRYNYSEYNVKKLEQQLAEAKTKYRNKFGELPSSLRDDNVRGGEGVKTPPKIERVMCCG